MTRSLRYGRELVAIPGPSVIPDRVLAVMSKAMPNIYQGNLIDTSLSILAELSGHYVDFEEAQLFGILHVGLSLHF